MIRYFCVCLYTVGLLLLVSSCSSTKSVKNAVSIEGMSERAYVETVMANAGGRSALTAKVALAIEGLGKGTTKVNGTLRIKKDEVIQLSVAPFLGIEVARAEFSPDGVLVIDRMNKRYVQASFSELGALAKVDCDFHLLQALFLNELFLPGKGDLTSRDAASFEVEQLPTGVWLDVKKTRRFRYRFQTKAPEGLLVQSLAELSGTPYGLNWEYADFRLLDKKPFPNQMTMLLEGGKRPLKASLKLSRLSTDADWEAHTKVSDKYERVELEDLIKILLNK